MNPSEAALRRSKRDHQPSAKAAASSASEPLVHALLSGSSRPQRRRAPPTIASAPLSLSAPISRVDSIGHRQRIRAAAAYTSSAPSVYNSGTHSEYFTSSYRNRKVLGRYASRDCAVLCEVILRQLETQTRALTVSNETKSPACIRWEAVAETMRTARGFYTTPQECQKVWKFLAYGQIAECEGTTELQPDSDEEEIAKSPRQINTQLAANRAKAAEVKLEGVKAASHTRTTLSSLDILTGGRSRNDDGPLNDDANARSAQRTACEAGAQPTNKQAPPIRLYPTYTLPTGTPDAWYRPFGLKDALPLTFVASRFLRRQRTPPPAPSQAEQVAILPGPSANATAELKRKLDENAEAAKKAKLVA